MENTGIPRDNAKRLLKDIKSIMKDPLHQEGIYYKHDETDMMKGYAMIVGPRDTIYENGFYFFDFIFPNDYPYSPPKLEFRTKTEYIRFHPNFYKNGKVCISLLNTWPGDPWTSCQSIRSILITLSMLFDNKPLLHEPGVTESHYDFQKYHTIIQYKNVEFAYYRIGNEIIKKNHIIPSSIYFHEVIEDHFKKEKNYMYEKVKNLSKSTPSKIRLSTSIYSMCDVEINYKDLFQKIKQIEC